MKYFYEIFDTCGDDMFVKYFKSIESVEDFVRNKVNELQANVEEYIKDFELFHKQWLYINLYLLFLNYFSLIVHLKQYLKNSHLQNIDLKS